MILQLLNAILVILLLRNMFSSHKYLPIYHVGNTSLNKVDLGDMWVELTFQLSFLQ